MAAPGGDRLGLPSARTGAPADADLGPGWRGSSRPAWSGKGGRHWGARLRPAQPPPSPPKERPQKPDGAAALPATKALRTPFPPPSRPPPAPAPRPAVSAALPGPNRGGEKEESERESERGHRPAGSRGSCKLALDGGRGAAPRKRRALRGSVRSSRVSGSARRGPDAVDRPRGSPPAAAAACLSPPAAPSPALASPSGARSSIAKMAAACRLACALALLQGWLLAPTAQEPFPPAVT